MTLSSSQPALPAQPREKRRSSPAAVGGVCALIAAFAPLAAPVLFILLSLPLLATAFILAIISLVKGRIAGGIALMVGLFFAGPIAFVGLTEGYRPGSTGTGPAFRTPSADPAAEAKQREERLQQAYANRRVFIGMTKDEVTTSWGRPANVNRSVYSNQVSEQWVYRWSDKTTYLYFDDGVLRSLQESQ